jgi:hypothetical protein
VLLLLSVLDGTKVAVVGRHSLGSRHGVDFWYLRFRVFRYYRFRRGKRSG